MPILAKQAIEATGLIENGQVFITVFRPLGIGKMGITSPRSAGTDPVSYAVGRQLVIVPTNITPIFSRATEVLSPVTANPTIASLIQGNLTLICADVALEPSFTLWRLAGKPEGHPSPIVSFLYLN